jgi:hypothetical protein
VVFIFTLGGDLSVCWTPQQRFAATRNCSIKTAGAPSLAEFNTSQVMAWPAPGGGSRLSVWGTALSLAQLAFWGSAGREWLGHCPFDGRTCNAGAAPQRWASAGPETPSRLDANMGLLAEIDADGDNGCRAPALAQKRRLSGRMKTSNACAGQWVAQNRQHLGARCVRARKAPAIR